MSDRILPIEESRKTIALIVQDRIRDAILSGLLPPGSRIDQNQLASDLNVSLVPVREALKKLEGEGFIHIVPRRGAFITKTSLEDMEDLYFTRSLLEGQTAYHAAEKLTDEAIEHMESLMREMDAALAVDDKNRFMRANRDFHFTIYNAVGSHYLSNMINGLWDLALRYRYRYMLLQNQASVLRQEHEVILKACHARDARALRDAVVDHMQQTLVGVREYLEGQGKEKKGKK
ncbi:MAG: GntR family transcriptional regulator [Anaerolineae bacterium]|nr:GntR family transcriptional regulator [Anaerolineae bacterium]